MGPEGHIASGHPADPALHLTPADVVKRRTRQGVACVEIQWHKQAGMPSLEQEYLTTIEKEELFTKAFPDVMRAYEEEKLASKPQKKGKRNAAQPTQSLVSGSSDLSESPSANFDEVDALSSAVSDLSLVQHSTSPYAAEARSSSRIDESYLRSSAQLPEVIEEGEHLNTLHWPNCNIDAPRSKSTSDVTFTSELSVRVALRLKKASEISREVSRKRDANSVFPNRDDKVSLIEKTNNSPDSSLFEVFIEDDDTFTNQKKDHNKCAASSNPEETNSSANHIDSLKKVAGKPLKKKQHQKKHRSASSSAALPSSTNNGRRKILTLSERKRLKKLLASLDDSTASVDEERPQVSQDIRPSLPLHQGLSANFSLGFEITKMLSEDDSMLQDLNSMDVSTRPEVEITTRDPFTEVNVNSSEDDSISDFAHVDRSRQVKDVQIYRSSDCFSGEVQGKPSPTSVIKDNPNFSFMFELTKMLEEDDSLLHSDETDFSVNGRTETRLTTGDEWQSGNKSEPLQQFTRTEECFTFTDNDVNTNIKTVNKDLSEAISKEEGIPDQMSASCLMMQKHLINLRYDNGDTIAISKSVASNLRSLDGPKFDLIREVGQEVDGEDGNTTEEPSMSIPEDSSNHGNAAHESPIHNSRQTSSEYLYQTFAPPPVDIETPTLCDGTSLGSFSQSQGSVQGEPDQCQPISATVLPSHQSNRSTSSQLKTNLIANHLSATPRSSQSQTLSHDYENSPVSLMDRLRIKHGGRDKKGVLSAVDSMKSGVKSGNQLGRDIGIAQN